MLRPSTLLKVFLLSLPLALALTVASLFIWSSPDANNKPSDGVCVGPQSAILNGAYACPPSPSSTNKGYPFSYVTASKTYDTYYYGSKPQVHTTKSFQVSAFALSFAAWIIASFGIIIVADVIVKSTKKPRKTSK